MRLPQALRAAWPGRSGVKRFAVSADREVCLVNRRLRIIDLDARAASRSTSAHSGSPTTASSTTTSSCGASWRRKARRSAPNPIPRCCWRHRTRRLRRARRCEGHVGVRRVRRRHAGRCCCCAAIVSARSRCTCIAMPPACISRQKRARFARSLGASLSPNLNQVERYLVNGYKSLYKNGETFSTGVTELAAGNVAAASTPTARKPPAATGRRDRAQSGRRLYGDAAVTGVRRRLETAVSNPAARGCAAGVLPERRRRLQRHRRDRQTRRAATTSHGFTVVDPDPRYDEGRAGRLGRGAGAGHPPHRCSVEPGELSRRPARAGAGTTTRRSRRSATSCTGADAAESRPRAIACRSAAPAPTSCSAATTITICSTWRAIQGGRRTRFDGGTPRMGSARQADRAQPVSQRSGSLRHGRRRFAITSISMRTGSARLYASHGGSRLSSRRYHGVDRLRNRMLNELFDGVGARSSCTRTTSTPCSTRSRIARRFSIGRCSSSPASIPTRHLVQHGFAKAVLRDAVRDIVPAGDCRQSPQDRLQRVDRLAARYRRSTTVRDGAAGRQSGVRARDGATRSWRSSISRSCPTARASFCSTSSTPSCFSSRRHERRHRRSSITASATFNRSPAP